MLLSFRLTAQLLSWPNGREACLGLDTSWLAEGGPAVTWRAPLLRCAPSLLHLSIEFRLGGGVFTSRRITCGLFPALVDWWPSQCWCLTCRGMCNNASIGHWASKSRMPGRRDRSVCAGELPIRNTIVRKMAAGWGIAGAAHLPTTAAGQVRIGKGAGEIPPPALAEGAIVGCSISNGDGLPAVREGAQDAFTQDTNAGCPIDQNSELTQTQRAGASAN